jgi:hypothetical protein
MSVSDVELLRAQQRSNIEAQMRALSRRMVELDPHPEIFEERARAAEVTAKLSDAFGRQIDRLALMFGLNAPEPQPLPSVTNNNLALINGTNGTDEVTFLRDLARFKEIQIGKHSREPKPAE